MPWGNGHIWEAMGMTLPWWSWLDRADAWVLTPQFEQLQGLFYLSLVVGFLVAWVWQKLR